MLSGFAMLTMSRPWDDEQVVLVPSSRASRARAEGGYREMEPQQAIWLLAGMDRWGRACLRDFVAEARLSKLPVSTLGSHKLRSLVRESIENGRLVALRKTECRIGDPTADQRQLLKFIEALTRGRLSHRGRQYKLVVLADLGRVADLDSYEVVRRPEADQILDVIAADSIADLGILLAQARDKLAADRRPLTLRSGGVILLRRTIRPREVSVFREPVIVPVQTKAVMKRRRPHRRGVVDSS
jgi:hypothetical protein